MTLVTKCNDACHCRAERAAIALQKNWAYLLIIDYYMDTLLERKSGKNLSIVEADNKKLIPAKEDYPLIKYCMVIRSGRLNRLSLNIWV
jgi:hypothetical protein